MTEATRTSRATTTPSVQPDQAAKRSKATTGRHSSHRALAGAIARAYCELYRKENRIYRVKIVSAMPLDNEEEQRLKKLISSHLGDASMEYTYSTDPDLIGGFTVDIDNERLDASVKNELKQLRLKLLKQA